MSDPISDFDFDSVEVLESAELRIKDPTRNNAPTNIVITLASPVHPARKREEQAAQRRMQAASIKAGRVQMPDPVEKEAEETETLAASTLGWAGSKIPFSREAARKLYADPKRLHIRTQVAAALNDMELFTRNSVTD